MNTKPTAPKGTIEPDLDSYNDMSVGEILSRTREHYGQTIPQVEVNLRIRATHLMALEKGDVANLPGRVYAIGFVRAYAEYLGLDGDKMVHLFKAQTMGKNTKPELLFPVTYEDTKTPNAYIIMGCLVGIILLITYWSVTYKPSNHIEIIPPVPDSLKQGSVPLIKKSEEKASSAIDKPSESLLGSLMNSDRMELIASADSWVEVKNADGTTLISKVMKSGETYQVPDEKGLILSTGNAGGISVFVKGKKITTLGRPAEVKRNIRLEAESFR